MRSEIRIINGVPELFANGRQLSRMWAMVGDAQAITQQYKDAKITTFLVIRPGSPPSFCKGCNFWNGAETYDFSKIDQLLNDILAVVPDASLILHPGYINQTPNTWNRNHPDELTLLHTGETSHASIASDVWLADSCNALKRYVEHFETGPYADHIIGYNPISGNSYEWLCWNWINRDPQKGFDDYSKPMTRRFRQWLAAQYNNDLDQLQNAWKDSSVTFETAEVPDVAKRFDPDNPHIFNNDRFGRCVSDYYRCYHQTNVQNGIEFCKAVKQALPTPKVTGLFHGYPYIHANAYSQHIGHGALNLLLKSKWIDFLQSPYSYINRAIGGCHVSQHPIESLHLRGKFSIDQTDTRTFLSEPADRRWGGTETLWQSLQLLKRDVAYAMSKNIPTYFLQWGKNNRWYDHPGLRDMMAQLKTLADANQTQHTEPVAEIAVIMSEQSQFVQTPNCEFGTLFVEATRNLIMPKIGAPFDDYLLSDFDQIQRKYKVYIFLNAYYIDSTLRKKVVAKLNAEHAAAIWHYAPGYIDQTGPNDAHIRELTGINIAHDNRVDYLHIDLTDLDHAYTRDIDAVRDFGSDVDPETFKSKAFFWPDDKSNYRFGPMFYACDRDAHVLGSLRAIDKPGLVVKNVNNRKSIFVAAPMMPWQILRNIIEVAGVHIYSRDTDLILANSAYLAICFADKGPRTIHLPVTCDVRDALAAEPIASNAKTIQLTGQKHETRIVHLTPN